VKGVNNMEVSILEIIIGSIIGGTVGSILFRVIIGIIGWCKNGSSQKENGYPMISDYWDRPNE